MTNIVGIDLGTTNSLIGIYGTEGARLLPNALGGLLTPSVVSLDESGRVLVGQAAKERLITAPGNTVAAFKRWMGTDRVTRLGGHNFRPEELSALVIKSLIADAESALGERVTEAVVSVPAYFGDAQRKATRIAGELAGITVERLINEPTAAALAYGLQERPEGGRFLVFDLGGGTFDVSILEMFDGVMEVHASAGDNFLGGDDFLSAIVSACLQDLGLNPAKLPPGERAQLLRRLEELKRRVSDQLGEQSHSVELNLLGKARTWSLDEPRLARICEPLMQRLRGPLERAMRDARLAPGQLDEIILVGGASRMPLAARLVSRMFGRLPLRHVNPDEAIARGAAVAAGMKARHEKLEEIILTDICPHTLGTDVGRELEGGEIQNGLFSPIIPRNSTVPVSRVERFWPLLDTQTKVVLGIYQGESPLVVNNVRLGELVVDLPPARHKNDKAVDLRFTYDINGLLQVEATVIATGEKHELVLEQNPGVLTPEEIRVRLAALAELKVHPRDQQENIALIVRAERLYEELLWARNDLQEALVRFRGALNTQEPETIREHRKHFAQMLEQIEARA